jgi:hypothetical protein
VPPEFLRSQGTELRRLETDEGRILDAYRTAFISPAQLGQQLQKLKAQRAACELRHIQAQQEASMPRAEIEKAVTDYCAESAKYLPATPPSPALRSGSYLTQ